MMTEFYFWLNYSYIANSSWWFYSFTLMSIDIVILRVRTVWNHLKWGKCPKKKKKRTADFVEEYTFYLFSKPLLCWVLNGNSCSFGFIGDQASCRLFNSFYLAKCHCCLHVRWYKSKFWVCLALQVLYVPDPEYISSAESSPSLSPISPLSLTSSEADLEKATTVSATSIFIYSFQGDCIARSLTVRLYHCFNIW